MSDAIADQVRTRVDGVAPLRFGCAVAAVGSALPEHVVPTAEIAVRFGVEPEWIVQRTGISERRYAAPGQRTSDLAADAGRVALERAGIAPEDVDVVIVGTTSADEIVGNVAPQVAHALGADRAGAMDVGAACTGFLSGLAMAAAWLEAGRADVALVIGAEVLSRITDTEDRRTAALFGDGAGAIVLTRTEAPGALGPVNLGSDGSGMPLLFATRERRLIEMEGQEVFRHAVARMTESTLTACAAAGLELTDIDLFVYHQANGRILRAVGQRLGIDPARVVDTIHLHGNTSAASIPLALAAAEDDGRLIPGARVLVSAFGAGFTWGGAVLEWKKGET
jgi:3-oxoacyl-[acyl-carrier-protein] synthase-3